MAALNTGEKVCTNMPVCRLTAPKQEIDSRVGACRTTGSASSGGIQHAAARPVALEVALVFAPQLNLVLVGQEAQFF